MQHRWVGGQLLVALVVVGVVAGCSGRDELRTEPGEDVPAAAVLEPGAEIADGFVVAEGTSVPGGAFPTPGGTYDGVESPRSWVAVIETDRDLPEAVDMYAQQAAELGFSLDWMDDEAFADAGVSRWCGTNVVREVDVSADLDGQPPAGTPLWVECNAAGERVVEGHLERLNISAIRSYPVGWGGPIDSFTISLLRWPPNRGTALLSPSDSVEPSIPVTTLPAPPTVSTLPEPSDGSTMLACNEAITLEPGSQLLGAAFDCTWPNSLLVLEVTGDPDEVFAAYVGQLDGAQGYNPPAQEEDPGSFDGRSVRAAQVSADDSAFLRITMLSGKGAPTVMSIQQQYG